MLFSESKVVSHVHPQRVELRHAVVPQGQPLGNYMTVDTLVGVRLSQQGHAEAAEVGPQEEVEGVQGVRASAGMLLVVLPAKLALRGELHATVIQQALGANGGIVLSEKQHTVHHNLNLSDLLHLDNP